MKKWVRNLVIGLASLVAICSLVVFGIWQYLKSGCGANVLERFPSPSGNLVAVAYNYDCGATTGFSTQISILDFGENPDDASDTFSIDDDHGRAVPTYSRGGPIVKVQWLSENQIEVSYPKLSRVFRNEDSAEDVTIKYYVY